jgi:hypothetical protein
MDRSSFQLSTPIDPIKGWGRNLTIDGVRVRVHARYEEILHVVTVIAYTPHCSVRCNDAERPDPVGAWSSAVAIQLIDATQREDDFLDAAIELSKAASELAAGVRRALPKGIR